MKQSTRQNLLFMLFSGVFIKILALVYKVFLVRILGLEGMSLYSIMIPTVMLFLGLADFALPQTITKLVAENITVSKGNRSLISKAIIIGILLNLILILILLIFMNVIIKSLNYDFRIPFYCLIILLPLVSINAVLKGYFQGKKMVAVGAKAGIIEQIARIASSLILLYILLPINITYCLGGLILAMAIGELFALFYYLFKLRKRSFKMLFQKNAETSNIISLSFPSTINRFVFTVSNFFEPIILTSALEKIGLDDLTIMTSYGIIQGYTIPLLTIMSFATYAVSTTLMPHLANHFKGNDIKSFNTTMKNGLLLSFIIGFLPTLLLISQPNIISFLLYNIEGIGDNIRLMAPFFILYYLEPILHTSIIILNKSNLSLVINIIICLFKLLMIYYLSLQLGILGFQIAIIISVILTVISYLLIIKKKTHFSLRFNYFKFILFILLNIIYTSCIITYESFLGIILIILFFILTTFIFFRKFLISFNDN